MTSRGQIIRYPPPPPFIRAVLLVQAFVRRRAFLRSFGGVGAGDNVDEEILELAPAKPLMAIALNFVRRLKSFRLLKHTRFADYTYISYNTHIYIIYIYDCLKAHILY